MQDVSSTKPAPLSEKWSGFGCAGVGCLSYALFAIFQTLAAAIVLFHAHPDLGTEALRRGGKELVTKWVFEVSSSSGNLFLFALVGDGVMIACSLLLAKYWLGARPSQLGLGSAPNARQIGVGIAAGGGLIVVADVVGAIQAHFFGPHTEQVALLLKTHHGAPSFLLDIAAVAVIVPFAEELLFRGVLFTGLAQRTPAWAAVVLSGIIFGVAHFDLWSIAPLAAIGMGLGYLYYRTRSLWPNIAAHATVNTFALILVYFFPKLAT